MLEERSFDDGIRLEVDADRHVAVVTIDRPPVNPVHGNEIVLRSLFQSFADMTEVSCVVLTGAGERAFCAGIDLRAAPSNGGPTMGQRVDSGRSWREAKASVFECAVPVIGAINGPAVGAGVGLAASCDILVAADHARFAMTELDVGALGGGSALLRLVGPQKMRRLYFTCDFVTAQELHELGTIDQVVPSAELLDTALALAARIAEKSPALLRMAKASLNRMEKSLTDWDAAYRIEQDYSARLSQFEDAREARQARAERRPPVWQGH